MAGRRSGAADGDDLPNIGEYRLGYCRSRAKVFGSRLQANLQGEPNFFQPYGSNSDGRPGQIHLEKTVGKSSDAGRRCNTETQRLSRKGGSKVMTGLLGELSRGRSHDQAGGGADEHCG